MEGASLSLLAHRKVIGFRISPQVLHCPRSIVQYNIHSKILWWWFVLCRYLVECRRHNPILSRPILDAGIGRCCSRCNIPYRHLHLFTLQHERPNSYILIQVLYRYQSNFTEGINYLYYRAWFKERTSMLDPLYTALSPVHLLKLRETSRPAERENE